MTIKILKPLVQRAYEIEKARAVILNDSTNPYVQQLRQTHETKATAYLAVLQAIEGNTETLNLDQQL